MPQAATCQTAALFAGVSFVITTTVKPRGCGSASRLTDELRRLLLEFRHRADHGGAPPPALDGFRKGYNELLVLKLATRTADRMEITDGGEEALRARHLHN